MEKKASCRKIEALSRKFGRLRPAKKLSAAMAVAALVLFMASCADGVQPEPAGEEEERLIKAELQSRSFRQFQPSKDGDPRKAVILDFWDGFSVWAQYSENRQAADEWEIRWSDYRIEKNDGLAEITILPENPRSSRIFPVPCEDCVPSSGVSVSIRNVLDKEKVEFKVNDPENALPAPFPAFSTWTRFEEDEIVFSDDASGSKSPVVVMETNKGIIELELNRDDAPVTVGNFIGYVAGRHYDGTVFHRVIKGFMIQGGGFAQNGSQKSTRNPIKSEAGNGLKNEIGTVSMARASDPDSAASQFFINTADNSFLDAGPGNPGYAVFGKVIKGMDVVRGIESVPTSARGLHENWPNENVIVERAYVKPN